MAGLQAATSSSPVFGSHRPHGSSQSRGVFTCRSLAGHLLAGQAAPMLAPMAERKCSICTNDTKNHWVAARHLEGHSASGMEEMSRHAGSPVPPMKRETIGKHIKTCLGAPAVKPEVVKAVAATVEVPDDSPEDVAVLVQKEVVRKLKAGEGRVTVQHGLQAQQLLDKRAERAKDRELAVTLARLLHSPAPPPTAITARPVDAIEGEVVEVASGD